MASAAAVRTSVTIAISRDLSPAAISAKLAAFAKADLARRQAAGQVPVPIRVIVNGRVGDREESVLPGGHIRYLFDYTGQILPFLVGFLRSRCPVESGVFRDSFFVSVNGGPPILLTSLSPSVAFAPAAELFIGNLAPYNRKIDVQFTGRQRLEYSVPAGMYDDAARALQQRWGGVVTVKRLNRLTFPGQYILRKGEKRGTPVDSPGLVIQRRG